jgi:hypothetical protein
VFQLRGEPIVEARREQVLSGRTVVDTAIRRDRAGFAATAKPTITVQTRTRTSSLRFLTTTSRSRARSSIIPDGNREVNSDVIASGERFIILPFAL